jgi:hypothetical protein
MSVAAILVTAPVSMLSMKMSSSSDADTAPAKKISFPVGDQAGSNATIPSGDALRPAVEPSRGTRKMVPSLV